MKTILRLLLGITSLALGSQWGQSQVVINEFLADNQTVLADEDAQFSDWIELHNPGTTAVNLSGWSLTDDASRETKWFFPQTNLAAKAFLVVFASGKDRRVPGSRLHTDFSLRASGEYLALLRPDGSVASELSPEYPAQLTDFSYGLVPEGWRYFSAPTPGSANSGGYLAAVADTKFSIDRGFFDAPFTLSITTATEAAQIVYTTNGSTPSLTNGLVYSGPILIRGTTVLRAAAFRNGFIPSNVDTETYLFIQDILRQSPNGEPPPGWPGSWGQNTVNYGMDPNVVNHPLYSSELTNALKSLPTFSIVTDLPNLFDPGRGIYANAGQDGIEWERPASVELIHPDGKKGFQANAGLRIRGGYSRSSNNPKHAFRLFFRSDYGPDELNYPIFARQNGTESFDSFDLRTFQNYSWSFEGDYRFIGLRDQWSRDAQLAMGQHAERGDYYHLYINGHYWGIYNTCERPEASFGESYFGGRKEDYDVVKVDTSAGYAIMATDGNLEAWTRLWRAATNGFGKDADYFRIQGLNVDGSPNPVFENLLDVDNLIDYMLVIFFSGNLDAPISAFLGNSNPNNMYGIRNRTGLYGGFRFVAHDSEHTLLHESSLGDNNEINRNRTGPFAAGDPAQQGAATAFSKSNPQYVFTRLTANAEFRLRLADRIHQRFFNGGALTTESCRARFLTRSNEIYSAVAAESARWGDSKREPARTRNVDWVTEMNRVYGNYFGQRPNIVLNQFRGKGWYPTLTAPSFNVFGGVVSNGFPLSLSAPSGTIYYTLDGTDPRLRGGAIAASSHPYSGPIPLTQSVRVKARALNGTTWSALTDATFYISRTFTELLITEIMYHPPGTTNLNGDAFEFIELKNVGATRLDLSGIQFTNGIDFLFPVGTTVAPGQFVVLAANLETFTNRYPGVRVDGVYAGRLSNQGETLALVHANGQPIFNAAYGTRAPWPAAADGTGFSVVPINADFNPDPSHAANWRASSAIGGSPGSDDAPLNVPPILISEALTHTDPPQLDAIELYNPTAAPVDVGNWYLTDQRTAPVKFRIPAPAVIPAFGYRVFTEAEWAANPDSTNSFRLDSHGEQIYLYSADASGNLTGYSDGFSFGAAENGVSFGRYVNSTGETQYPAQSGNTLGDPNAGPRIGPLVINEIHYHPSMEGDEFIEIRSLTNGTLKLYDLLYPTNTWRLNGLGFSFPQNSELSAQGFALVVGTDPAAFRARYGVPASVPIFGPYSGSLQNGGEALALQSPDHPDVDPISGAVFVPYIDVDVVSYSDQVPWPTNADGAGSSLEKLSAASYGNDPNQWRASAGGPSPGRENSGNRPPVVFAGPDRILLATATPITLDLAGATTDDHLPAPPAQTVLSWSQVSGPGPVWFDEVTQSNTTVHLPGIGQYVLRLTADDGAIQVSDLVTVIAEHAGSAIPVTLVSRGSVWKYLDTGTNAGTAWVGPGFGDGSWASGKAPLGYSDANGQWPATTNSFGPNSSSKYVTTYYRLRFDLADTRSLVNPLVRVQRDDGVLVYLNGTPIFTNNLPMTGTIGYLTPATQTVGGADETTWYSTAIDPRLLVNGPNVLAAEVHQVNGTSTDIFFDLELAAETVGANQGPSASAGIDQTISTNYARLQGSTSDDGLPIPPGFLSFSWGKVSGPGTVSFGNQGVPETSVSFSEPGSYTLRLTVTDGLAAAEDTVVITVNHQGQPPFRIDSVQVREGASPMIELQFTATAGRSYQVQYSDSLASGGWLVLTNLPPQPSTGPVLITDPVPTGSKERYYRIVNP